jgi:hypothetical protein
MATMSATRIRMRTMSIQNLWGFLIFYTIPFSFLFDWKRFSLTLSTWPVSCTILLSVVSISSPVIRRLFFHFFIFSITSPTYSSIYLSIFYHSFIFVIYIYVGASFLYCLEIMRLFFCFPGSSSCSLI